MLRTGQTLNQPQALHVIIRYWIEIRNTTYTTLDTDHYIPVRIFLENWVGMALC